MRTERRSVIDSSLSRDLDLILARTEGLWRELQGKRLFMTGGTGFLGSFDCANERLGLNASALVLTRNHESFRRAAPHLASNPAIGFHSGDVRTFEFPNGEFSHVIHAAATSAEETFRNEDAVVKFDTVVGGTRRILDFAVQCHAKKFLLTSSGVVYGKQPPDITHLSEEYGGQPDPTDPNSALGESK